MGAVGGRGYSRQQFGGARCGDDRNTDRSGQRDGEHLDRGEDENDADSKRSAVS